MPELLKDRINHALIQSLALSIHAIYDDFDVEKFISTTMDSTWDKLELKARVRKISSGLGCCLPENYKEALAILDQVAGNYSSTFAGTCFPDFVELYGQDERDWDASISALERYTVYSSSEFAVRPFIINDEARMMAQMYAWSKHDNEHVRRLASEGCRPQLPWGQVLTSFKKDPTPILPILEQLKDDPSLYVRKSVANNLNDISKTHPDLVVSIAKQWCGKSERTDWIIKHGCRTLLKKGNRDALALFGYHDVDSLAVENFALNSTTIPAGGELVFFFSVFAGQQAKVRLEYAIDYVKANAKRNRKIFQISEITIKENEKKLYSRKHSFADVSTRKHYPGKHSVTLIVNGVERGTLDFELLPQ
ncbi:DNA alkylation repair protein [Eubacteriales bacterium OttesenSCG-928-K08]|nr:DNA alkylation repair protein [Eubacteriales bacterium OttesenSCG-928-K08]